MPSLHSSGVITPGVLGPIMFTPFSIATVVSISSSCAGSPSVIITTGFNFASIASKAASLAEGAGTKMIEALASCSSKASSTES